MAPADTAMPHEQPMTAWNAARLAAISASVRRMSHDLRGAMSAALLVADRLTLSGDAPTRQAGEVIVRSVHRATAISQHTLDLVREGPAPPQRQPVVLRDLAEQAIARSQAACAFQNTIAAHITATLPPDLLSSALSHLFARAVAAGARHVEVSAEGEGATLALNLLDDATAPPPDPRDTRSAPFTEQDAAAFDLAIARDFVRALGGDLRLRSPGSDRSSLIVHLYDPGATATERTHP